MTAETAPAGLAQQADICGDIVHTARFEWVCVKAPHSKRAGHWFVRRYPHRNPGGTA